MLIAAIVASVPAVLAMESFLHLDQTVVVARLGIGGPRTGPWTSTLTISDEGATQFPASAPRAEVIVTITDRLHGWPMTTRVTRNRVDVTLNDLQGNGHLPIQDLEVDPRVAGAVRPALIAGPQRTVAEDERPPREADARVTERDRRIGAVMAALGRAWTDAGPVTGPDTGTDETGAPAPRTPGDPGFSTVHRVWVSTIGATVSAWVLLSIGVIALSGVGRYLSNVGGQVQRERKKKRSNSMRCVSCGFDLQGNVFTERCPECGALAE